MGSCVIFCAGEFDALAEPLAPDDFVIAADGGLRHLGALGRAPDCILGDFDSLGYTPGGAEVFPVQKDDTDSMLAVRHGLKLGFRRFVLYGALDGPRLDHTLANLQLLRFLAQHGAQGYLVGLSKIATVVQDGTICFPAQSAGILSLFCMGRDADGVTLHNLQYPLTRAALSGAMPLGVSNHFTGQPSSVTVERGCLLAIYDRENGFPIRGRSL